MDIKCESEKSGTLYYHGNCARVCDSYLVGWRQQVWTLYMYWRDPWWPPFNIIHGHPRINPAVMFARKGADIHRYLLISSSLNSTATPHFYNMKCILAVVWCSLCDPWHKITQTEVCVATDITLPEHCIVGSRMTYKFHKYHMSRL